MSSIVRLASMMASSGAAAPATGRIRTINGRKAPHVLGGDHSPPGGARHTRHPRAPQVAAATGASRTVGHPRTAPARRATTEAAPRVGKTRPPWGPPTPALSGTSRTRPRCHPSHDSPEASPPPRPSRRTTGRRGGGAVCTDTPRIAIASRGTTPRPGPPSRPVARCRAPTTRCPRRPAPTGWFAGAFRAPAGTVGIMNRGREHQRGNGRDRTRGSGRRRNATVRQVSARPGAPQAGNRVAVDGDDRVRCST